MAGIGAMAKRMAGSSARAVGRTAARGAGAVGSAVYKNTSEVVGKYVREYGFVGNVLSDATNNFLGDGRTNARQSQQGGAASSGLFSGSGGGAQVGATITSLLSSIDRTLKSIYNHQLKSENQDLYDEENVRRKDRLGAMSPVGKTGESSSGGVGGILTMLGGAVTALMASLGSLLPKGLASVLSKVVLGIGDALISGVAKLLAAAGIGKAVTSVLPGGKGISTGGGIGRTAAKVGGGAVGALGAGAMHYMDQKSLDEALASGAMNRETFEQESRNLKGRTAGGIVGGLAGGAAGSFAGPAGAFAGGVAGGLIGSAIGEGISKALGANKTVISSPSEGVGRGGNADASMGGINFEAYREALAMRESGGRYDAENSIGYLGKYQFGAAALKDLGVIRPDAKGSNKEIFDNPKNWIGGLTKQAFLKNAALQEDLFRQFTKRNYNEGMRLGIIKKNDKPELVASKLAARHLSGWGNEKVKGARHFFESGGKEVAKDAYGTKVSEYAALGASSQATPSVVTSVVTTPTLDPSKITPSGGVMAKGVDVNKGSTAQTTTNVNIVGGTNIAPISMGGAQGGGGGAAKGIPAGIETPVMDESLLTINDLIRWN